MMRDKYKTILSHFDDRVLIGYKKDTRFSSAALLACRDDALSSFDVDNGTMYNDICEHLLLDCRSPEAIDSVSSFINKYLEPNSRVTMSVLLADLFSFFEISNVVWCNAAMAVGVYAEIPHNLEYHNNAHFKKVVLHMARLIMAHNHIFENTSNALMPDKVALLLIAAAIHDLGHEGKGNIVDRKYILAKTERHSFDIIAPVLMECGLTRNVLDDLLVLLMATDVSPFGDPLSPANQVRAAYDFHFGDSEDDGEFELCAELDVLSNRADLCAMALMLHEADIMNSAGVSYDMTKQESCAVSLEEGRKSAFPEDTLLFLNKICNEQMSSAAAQLVGAKAMDEIRKKVIEDFKNGNKSYL